VEEELIALMYFIIIIIITSMVFVGVLERVYSKWHGLWSLNIQVKLTEG